MNKTLRISFALKNAYRVNSILYAIRQIPFVKKIVPVNLYGVRGPKIFANILSVIWEILSAFLGKFLYFITMVMGVGILYKKVPSGPLFLHILVFLTVIAGFFVEHFKGKLSFAVLGMVLGTIVCYLFGTIWLSMQLNIGFVAGLGVGVFPYIPGDLVKIAIVCIIGPKIRRAVVR